MCFIGTLIFYTKFIEKINIDRKPFYGFLLENTPWNWTPEHGLFFTKLKSSLTTDTELTIPNTYYHIFTVNDSLIGLGAVIFQLIENNKMKVISYKNKSFPYLTVNYSVLYMQYKSMNFALLDLHI